MNVPCDNKKDGTLMDAAAQQASCALQVQLTDDADWSPPNNADVALFTPLDDSNSRYDCLDLGSSYPSNYYRKLDLTQLNLGERLRITAVKMNSDLGAKMIKKLGASYNYDEPVFVLQAGGTKLEDDDIDGANGMNQLFNRADKNGVDFFMVIHGVDSIKTGGYSGATTRLRGFNADLKLAAQGNEWVATGGAEDSRVDVLSGNTEVFAATYWDNTGYTFVKDFDFDYGSKFVCLGFSQDKPTVPFKKISTCACVMAFSESATNFLGNRRRTVHVPTKDGCHEIDVKATANIANQGGLPVEIKDDDFSVDCYNDLGPAQRNKVNEMINTCGGNDAYF